MTRLGAALLALLLAAAPASAADWLQDYVVPTAPHGTNNNRSASTAFVQDAVSGVGVTLGTSTITGGSAGRVLYDNSGFLGEYPITGTGSVVLSASPTLTGTVTINGTIVDSGGNVTSPSVVLKGSSSGQTTLQALATASGTLTVPSATDTLIGKATTDTLTNKTFDTAGAGNVFRINGTGVSAVTGTGSAVLGTSPSIASPTITGTASGNGTLPNAMLVTPPVVNVTTTWISASTTYNRPTGFIKGVIDCWGAGGAGGGAAGSGAALNSGGGGGAGAHSVVNVDAATLTASQTVTIGAGGTAGTAGNVAGNAGGDTSVGTLCLAKGGSGGGGGGTFTPGAGGAGGAGGSGTGDLTASGGSGFTGTGFNGNTLLAPSGQGASCGDLGGGGVGKAAAIGAGSAGNAATGFCSGGGGGVENANAANVAGGVGSGGLVKITAFLSQ